MRFIASMILMLGTSVSTSVEAEVPFNGKSGAGLQSSLADSCCPLRIVEKSRISEVYYDPFSSCSVAVVSGVLPDGYVWGSLLPEEWWGYSSGVYGEAIAGDIFNIFPVNKDVAMYRRDLPPGNVDEPKFQNDYWSAGIGHISFTPFECYTPPESMRGAFARLVFYMSVVYHVDLWTERASLVMTSKSYPGLTDYAIPLLLSWHRLYPPTVDENLLNDLAVDLQGNRNPFVDYPELAEYLWGENKGQVFLISGEPVPLRSTYRLSDGEISLYSPHIPSDAVWSVDGIPVSLTVLSAEHLGIGSHELKYSSSSTGENGSVLIKIVE